MTGSSIRASRKQLGRDLDGAYHTIVVTTPTARVALVVMFAGLVSAENKVADTNRARLKQGLAGHNVHIDTRFFIVENRRFRGTPCHSAGSPGIARVTAWQ